LNCPGAWELCGAASRFGPHALSPTSMLTVRAMTHARWHLRAIALPDGEQPVDW
jgi:hypothetical protein